MSTKINYLKTSQFDSFAVSAQKWLKLRGILKLLFPPIAKGDKIHPSWRFIVIVAEVPLGVIPANILFILQSLISHRNRLSGKLLQSRIYLCLVVRISMPISCITPELRNFCWINMMILFNSAGLLQMSRKTFQQHIPAFLQQIWLRPKVLCYKKRDKVRVQIPPNRWIPELPTIWSVNTNHWAWPLSSRIGRAARPPPRVIIITRLSGNFFYNTIEKSMMMTTNCIIHQFQEIRG